MKRLFSWVGALLAVGVVGALPSCSSDKAEGPGARNDDVAKSGNLKMALQTTSASGKVYRLRNAVLPVVNQGGFGSPVVFNGVGTGVATFDGGVFPFGDASTGFGGFFGAGGTSSGGSVFSTGGTQTGNATVILRSEDDPTRPVLETFLSPSFYSVQLLDGWFIEQVDLLLGTSAFDPSAQLLSSATQFFDITSGQETFVQYDFLVDGQRISFGDPGRLIVGIQVQENNQKGFCGDGIVDPGESCDSFNLGGQTCGTITLGSLPFGNLSCTPGCFFDLSGCFGSVPPDGGTGGGGQGTGGAPGKDGGPAGGFPGFGGAAADGGKP